MGSQGLMRAELRAGQMESSGADGGDGRNSVNALGGLSCALGRTETANCKLGPFTTCKQRRKPEKTAFPGSEA